MKSNGSNFSSICGLILALVSSLVHIVLVIAWSSTVVVPGLLMLESYNNWSGPYDVTGINMLDSFLDPILFSIAFFLYLIPMLIGIFFFLVLLIWSPLVFFELRNNSTNPAKYFAFIHEVLLNSWIVFLSLLIYHDMGESFLSRSGFHALHFCYPSCYCDDYLIR